MTIKQSEDFYGAQEYPVYGLVAVAKQVTPL